MPSGQDLNLWERQSWGSRSCTWWRGWPRPPWSCWASWPRSRSRPGTGSGHCRGSGTDLFQWWHDQRLLTSAGWSRRCAEKENNFINLCSDTQQDYASFSARLFSSHGYFLWSWWWNYISTMLLLCLDKSPLMQPDAVKAF